MTDPPAAVPAMIAKWELRDVVLLVLAPEAPGAGVLVLLSVVEDVVVDRDAIEVGGIEVDGIEADGVEAGDMATDDIKADDVVTDDVAGDRVMGGLTADDMQDISSEFPTVSKFEIPPLRPSAS